MAFMRHNNNGRRHGGHNNRHRGPNNNQHGNNSQHGNTQQGQNGQRRHVNRMNHVFDSNGPDGRIRGTAQQIVEKFTAMARDASVSGDKVLMQNYFQHAEHYQRLANEILEENAIFEREREQQRQQQQASQPEFVPTESSDAFAASAPVPSSPPVAPPSAPAPKAAAYVEPAPMSQEELDSTSSLPSFVQVPISAAPPAPGTASAETGRAPTLKSRAPRRTPAADKTAE